MSSRAVPPYPASSATSETLAAQAQQVYAAPAASAVAGPVAALPAKPNPIRQLTEHFTLTHDLVHCEGRPYAVPRDGTLSFEGPPGIAQPFGAALRRKIVRLSVLPGLPKDSLTRAAADTVMLQLEAKAFEGPETPLALRFAQQLASAEQQAGVWVDLGGTRGKAVAVGPAGWSVVRPPEHVVFRRSHATKPLPAPARGGRLVDLAELLALDPAGEVFRALLGWAIGLPFVSSVRPGALLVGPYGSGKSTRLRLVTSLFEPSDPHALGSAFGRNFGDDQVRALHRAVPLWDNLTSVSGATSDELCCLITGTARETRALYSDNDMNTVPVQRPIGLTAVGVPAGLRPDALDRLVVLDVPPIAARVEDAELQQRFDAAHPQLLGALCDAVAAVLRWRDRIPAPTQYRMAGHARILSAVDAAVLAGELPGCPYGLLEAYVAANTRVKQRTAAEDTFGGALLALLEARGGQWHGKASELLTAAGLYAPWNDRGTSGWPSSARRVPELLAHLREGLAALGVSWQLTTVRGSTRYSFTLSEIPGSEGSA